MYYMKNNEINQKVKGLSSVVCERGLCNLICLHGRLSGFFGNADPDAVQPFGDLLLQPSVWADDEEVDWAADDAEHEQRENQHKSVGNQREVLAETQGAVLHSLLDRLARQSSADFEKPAKVLLHGFYLQFLMCCYRDSLATRAWTYNSTTADNIAYSRLEVKPKTKTAFLLF